MRPAGTKPLIVLLLALVIGGTTGGALRASPGAPPQGAPPCRPIDSAWAALIRVVDAQTRRPVKDVTLWSMLTIARTDSLGYVCLRDRDEAVDTLRLGRRGYHDEAVVVSGRAGSVVLREIEFRRVDRPCCDLRGEWSLQLVLDSPSRMHPKPAARTTTGPLRLGPHVFAPEEEDGLDSLVRPVRGLHDVDLAPFFGGPYGRDVSTSVIGGGGGSATLFREVMATVDQGDSVSISIIPRMSHGGLSLWGVIAGDSVTGEWLQNAYCCGATGRFVMRRTAPPDTTRYSGPITPNPFGRVTENLALPPASVPAGSVPRGRWRPAFDVAQSGALWFAPGGLFVSDSFGSEWRRALGGPEDGVEKDELRIEIALAFVGTDVALLGLKNRYPVSNAPILYRTTDRGRSWSAIAAPGVGNVRALGAYGSSVWLFGGAPRGAAVFHLSGDAGETWEAAKLPERLRDPLRVHRETAEIAYLATSARDGRPAFWQTVDGGANWARVPTPADQRLQRLGEFDTRIEEVARVGGWLVVTEHGRVFATRTSHVRWTALKAYRHVASDPRGDVLFVIRSDLRPALLDSELKVVWVSDSPLELRNPGDIEQVRWLRDRGYVTTGNGSLFEIRNGVVRQLAK
jgi:photosystem II stability/assembly factor-like uncharacterized protein